jgi:hypothetical protein
MTRYAKKVDANQQKIVDALRAVGCTVFVIGRPFDLLVARHKKLYLMEVKNPLGKNKLSSSQLEDIKELLYRGVHVSVVRNVNDALKEVDAI